MRFTDPDGMKADDLILKRDATVLAKTQTTINAGLGGENFTNIDSNGKVTLNVCAEHIKNFTTEQKAFYEVMNDADPTKSYIKLDVF